tara:strand:- start:1141 stop:2421 length:1281 start_codon:yes stop_codon:yes gene_type:complete
MLKDRLNPNIAIIGLGYVGLPLAVEFSKKFQVIGFDLNKSRIQQLNNYEDVTKEVTREELKNSLSLQLTHEVESIENCDTFIVTVPTPITDSKEPNLDPLKNASELVGKCLKKNDVVIFESTVYPGATEEVCVPIIEDNSNLSFNKDFFVGYSPERINPGDKDHKLKSITKVTSGSTKEAADYVDWLYSSIIDAGTFQVSSIKVAEAAKVIENTQRDVNIALINELSIIFNTIGIDTEEVLDAAGTKWNFLPFRPGLVGGHCIGVDPYYLTYKAESMGYKPEIILAGRRLNDGMGSYISSQLISAMKAKDIKVEDSNVLVMGLTFKENCPDLRNTKVIDVINSLIEEGLKVECYDPWVDPSAVVAEYGVNMIDKPKDKFYDAIVLAVAHKEFVSLKEKELIRFLKKNYLIYDLKYILPKDSSDIRL